MPELLRIIVVHLKGAVVDVRRWVAAHKKGMMIYIVLTPIDVSKYRDNFPCFLGGFHVEEVCRHKVEVSRIELKEFIKLRYTETEMAELSVRRFSDWK